MDVFFEDEDLARLEADPSATNGLSAGVVKSFRKRMNLIRSAPDERDVFTITGPKNIYKLHGDRAHQHALRLNDQWRLIIEIQKGERTRVKIVAIEDYHS